MGSMFLPAALYLVVLEFSRKIFRRLKSFR